MPIGEDGATSPVPPQETLRALECSVVATRLQQSEPLPGLCSAR